MMEQVAVVIGSYDLLILDWMLRGKTGLEICQELRRQGKTTSVLFLYYF
jgi:OmpR-family two-component system manganese-sensing response regulator